MSSRHEGPTPTPLKFSDNARAEIERHCKKYPDRAAALLPTLYIAQDEFGHISPDAMVLVAQTLGVPETRVREVATWYTMFHTRPVGRFHVEVCTNISCHLLGADTLVDVLKKHLGIKPGETTPDGKYTLHEVECLASCGSGPCMTVNNQHHEHLTADKALDILRNLN